MWIFLQISDLEFMLETMWKRHIPHTTCISFVLVNLIQEQRLSLSETFWKGADPGVVGPEVYTILRAHF